MLCRSVGKACAWHKRGICECASQSSVFLVHKALISVQCGKDLPWRRADEWMRKQEDTSDSLSLRSICRFVIRYKNLEVGFVDKTF